MCIHYSSLSTLLINKVVLVETFLAMDQPVADYNTEATGLTAADVEGHVALHMTYVQVHDCFI